MTEELVVEKIIKQRTFREDEELSAQQMFTVMKGLHKRCKSKRVWADFEMAFKQSFGAMEGDRMRHRSFDSLRSLRMTGRGG